MAFDRSNVQRRGILIDEPLPEQILVVIHHGSGEVTVRNQNRLLVRIGALLKQEAYQTVLVFCLAIVIPAYIFAAAIDWLAALKTNHPPHPAVENHRDNDDFTPRISQRPYNPQPRCISVPYYYNFLSAHLF